jgi:UDPglucose 6-dehydrogenase
MLGWVLEDSACPKDIHAFIRLAEKHGIDFGLLREVEAVNKRPIDEFVKKVRRALWVVKEKRIGVLGLAFKPNTDDVRFAPAIEVVRRLLAERATVRASDPFAIERARLVLDRADFVEVLSRLSRFSAGGRGSAPSANSAGTFYPQSSLPLLQDHRGV